MFSFRWRVLALLMSLIFVMVVVSACGGTDNRQEEAEQAGQQEELEQQREELEQMQEQIEQQQQELEQQQQEAEQQGDQGQQAADNGAQEDEGAGGASGGGGGSGNVYQVGPAGEVELRDDNGRLVLVDARPNQGWRVEDVEEEADEVELDFVRGNEEWKFEAELEEGQIDVEIERDFDD